MGLFQLGDALEGVEMVGDFTPTDAKKVGRHEFQSLSLIHELEGKKYECYAIFKFFNTSNIYVLLRKKMCL